MKKLLWIMGITIFKFLKDQVFSKASWLPSLNTVNIDFSSFLNKEDWEKNSFELLMLFNAALNNFYILNIFYYTETLLLKSIFFVINKRNIKNVFFLFDEKYKNYICFGNWTPLAHLVMHLYILESYFQF